MHDQGPGCFTRGREQSTAYSAYDGARRRGQSPQLASLDDLCALGSTNGKPRAGALPVLMLDPKLTPRARCVAVHDGRTGRTVVCASTVNVGLVKVCACCFGQYGLARRHVYTVRSTLYTHSSPWQSPTKRLLTRNSDVETRTDERLRGSQIEIPCAVTLKGRLTSSTYTWARHGRGRPSACYLQREPRPTSVS